MTIRHVVSIASCFVVLAAAASAQSTDAQTLLPTPVDVRVITLPAPQGAGAPRTLATPQAPVKTPTQTPTPTTQTPPAPTPQTQLLQPRKSRGRDVNVQVEVTITEHQGSDPGQKRVVSMIVADAMFGRIRSNTANNDVRLNVDATPTVLENDRLSLELTVEYVPILPEGASRRPAGLLETLTVILQNGKPLLLSQASDPTIDRRITLEVRASILK